MTGDPAPQADRLVPLSTLPDGTTARLVRVDGGPGLRSRLTAMGLRPGAEVRVVHNGGRGPFVVAAGEARIVLGRGMAFKVLVATNGAG
jgi:ferrous iron transport protein A